MTSRWIVDGFFFYVNYYLSFVVAVKLWYLGPIISGDESSPTVSDMSEIFVLSANFTLDCYVSAWQFSLLSDNVVRNKFDVACGSFILRSYLSK